jgi:hypothetical protein
MIHKLNLQLLWSWEDLVQVQAEMLILENASWTKTVRCKKNLYLTGPTSTISHFLSRFGNSCFQ